MSKLHRFLQVVGPTLIVGLLGIAVAQNAGILPTVRTTKLEIVDNAGRTRAILGADTTGNTTLIMYDKNGTCTWFAPQSSTGVSANPAPAPQEADDIVVDCKVRYGYAPPQTDGKSYKYPMGVQGLATNTGQKTYSQVTVWVTFLDKNGVSFKDKTVTKYQFGPGQSWKFLLEWPFNASSIQVTKIDKY